MCDAPIQICKLTIQSNIPAELYELIVLAEAFATELRSRLWSTLEYVARFTCGAHERTIVVHKQRVARPGSNNQYSNEIASSKARSEKKPRRIVCCWFAGLTCICPYQICRRLTNNLRHKTVGTSKKGVCKVSTSERKREQHTDTAMKHRVHPCTAERKAKLCNWDW